MTIVEFLRARLDEDEAIARARFLPLSWRVDPETPTQVRVTPADEDAEQTSVVAFDGVGAATHIARWDPERVLREVEAKRRIVDAWSHLDRANPVDAHAAATVDGARRACDSILKILAALHADHPDYDPAWQ